ncbi:hypothetical protein L3X38_025864 [Prunus dulcis]|uniref:Uncharacterized protein n=1 Tax=Prunus dulcis TaxID=3755 RepID=A0AAD4W2G4_PRUDU|nr:hypothetical protein L3X38_025864 [Prunus dulcis]
MQHNSGGYEKELRVALSLSKGNLVNCVRQLPGVGHAQGSTQIRKWNLGRVLLKLELQRRHVQSLSEAIVAAESLVEFKKNDQSDSKFKVKKGNSGSSGEDNKSKEGDKSSDKSDSHKSSVKKNDKGDKGKDKSKLACYLCNGPHMMRDCSRTKALNAMNQEKEEETNREAGMGAIHHFNAL